MRARFALVATSLSIAVACNTIAGLDGDFSLAGGEGGDAGEDASTADAIATDGGQDAPIDTGPPTPFCKAQGPDMVFCADFESNTEGQHFGWDFTELIPPDVTRVDVLPGIGKDGSKGLRAYAGSTSTSRKVGLWETIGTPGMQPPTVFAHYELDFDFRVAANTLDYAVIGYFGFRQTSAGTMVYYGPAMYGHTPGTIDVSNPPGSVAAPWIPEVAGAWHHGRAVMDRITDGGLADGGHYGSTLNVDGVDVDVARALAVNQPATNYLDVRVGAFFTDGNPGIIEVIIDNVVVRRR